MYRACFADGSELPGAARPGGAWPRRSATLPARPRPPAFGRFCDWLTDLYRLELPNFIDRNFDSPLDLAQPARAARPPGAHGRAAPAGQRGRPLLLRPPPAAAVLASRPCTPACRPFEALALYCVITYMDTVEGVYFPEGGMHAMPPGLAAAAEKAGATFRYGTTVERRSCRTAGRRPGRPASAWTAARCVAADAVVLNPDLPVAYRELLPGVAPPRVRPQGQLLAVVRGVAGRRARATCPPGAAHHNIHFGAEWEGAFDAPARAGRAHARPVDPGHQPDRVRPRRWRPPAARRSTCSSRCPTSTARSTGPRERDRLRERLIGPGGGARLPGGRRRGRALRRPHRLGAPGHGAGHAVRPGPQLLPDRPVPAQQRRPPRRPGVVFVGSGTVPGRGGADGAAVRAAGRRPGRRAGRGHGDAVAITLEESYARCRQLNRRYGTTYYWSTHLLPRSSATTSTPSTASAATPTTSSTTSGSTRPAERAPAGPRRLRRPVLRRPRAGARPTTRCSRRWSTPVKAFDIDPDCFRRFLRSMAMDFTVETYETLEDLLGYMDGSAAVIGEMMLPILEPPSAGGVRARPRPGHRLPALQLPARTWTRTSTGAGSTSPRRTCGSSAPTRGCAGSRPSGATSWPSRSPAPGALRVGRPGHPHAAAGVGPLHPGRPGPVLAASSTEIEKAGYDVFAPGCGCRPGRSWRSAFRMLPTLTTPA